MEEDKARILKEYIEALKRCYSRAEVLDAVHEVYGDSYGLPEGYAREVPLYEG